MILSPHPKGEVNIYTSVTSILAGWSIGSTYMLVRNKEREIEQGNNPYLSGPFKAMQINLVYGAVYPYTDKLQGRSRAISKISLNVLSLFSIPFFLLYASVKKGDYTNFAEKWNNFHFTCSKPKFIPEFFSINKSLIRYLPERYARGANDWNQNKIALFAPFGIPTKLGSRTIKVISFCGNHATKAAQVAIIITSLALIYFGNPFFGGATLFAISFQIIDNSGFLPRKVSLFAERYFPALGCIGGTLGGPFVNRIAYASLLPLYLSASFYAKFQQKLAGQIDYWTGSSGLSLEEIEAPLVRPGNLSFDKIKEILNSTESSWKINPAFCSKPVLDLSELPADDQFEKFFACFDRVSWEGKYGLLLKKVQDDDRFKGYLTEQFSSITENDLENKEIVEGLIGSLAKEEKISREKYLVNWIRNELVGLVSVLKGKERVKGNQTDLDTSIKYAKVILPYLESIETTNPIEFEDIILKLAIEGGGYCGRGIKRAMSELLLSIRVNSRLVHGMTPKEDYELRVKTKLAETRMQILQGCYSYVTENIHLPDPIKQDVHGFDIYRLLLSMGFYPLTDFERETFGMVHLIPWMMIYRKCIQFMYTVFKQRLYSSVEELGLVHLGQYVVELINSNENLREDEKEKILNIYTEDPSNANQLFARLLLVNMGVLTRA